MTEIGIVRQIAGDWIHAQGVVRLRIEADRLDQPLDALIPLRDVQALIRLLLVLSDKAGPASPNDATAINRVVKPLPLDSVNVGETDYDGTVLQLSVGRTTLDFFLPMKATQGIGRTLLELAAARAKTTN